MRFVICDVFTDRPLAGNQLAVFTDGAEVPDRLRQPLAREINFSETVFVEPPADPAKMPIVSSRPIVSRFMRASRSVGFCAITRLPKCKGLPASVGNQLIWVNGESPSHGRRDRR